MAKFLDILVGGSSFLLCAKFLFLENFTATKIFKFFFDFCVQFLAIFMAYRSEFDFEIHYSRPLKRSKFIIM